MIWGGELILHPFIEIQGKKFFKAKKLQGLFNNFSVKAVRILPLIFVAVGISCSSHGENLEQAAEVGRITTIDLCSARASEAIEDALYAGQGIGRNGSEIGRPSDARQQVERDRIIRDFDTDKHRCMSAARSDTSPSSFQQRPLYRRYGTVKLKDRIVPVAVSWREDANFEDVDAIQQIIVRTPGGPGGVEIFPAMDEITPVFGNAIVIDFYYTGHGFNILHPRPSFEVAVEQLREMMERLRSRNPRAETILMGESLGSVIALAALDGLSAQTGEARPIADKLVLLAPPFASLRETASILRRISPQAQAGENRFLYRVRGQGEDYNEYGSLQLLDGFEVFDSFAGENESTISLNDRMMAVENLPPTLLIFGGRDERISLDDAEAFLVAPLKNVKVLRIANMDHRFENSDQARKIFDRVDGFFLE